MNAQANEVLETTTQRSRHPAVQIRGPRIDRGDEVLTPGALGLLVSLHSKFDGRRQELLAARARRQAQLDAGVLPDFLPETQPVREAAWRIGHIPADLLDRRVEITGPVERKMIINALNAPVSCFMADFEDACSPTWDNLIQGQINLADAIRRTIAHVDAATGRYYQLAERTATLIVRPRGWHLPEKHVHIGGQAVAGALLDFSLFLANNAEELIRRGSGPYFYLPKLESHLEARLWNDVFNTAEEALALPRGAIKATVLIETLPAAFEMDEILFELRERATGLNCGRWDYIFSFIKKLRHRPQSLLPDRATVTMERPFLKSYVELLIKTCHRRGAYAMGGMSACIPVKEPKENAAVMQQVRADKLREARAGHDGTWIAHPGLAAVARGPFDELMPGPHQLHVLRNEVSVTRDDLLRAPAGEITEAGVRHCIRVGVQYLEAWLNGTGCVPLYNLMEDAATAEICRAQLWQCVHHGARTSDGQLLTVERFDRLMGEELDRLHGLLGPDRLTRGVFPTATRLLEQLVRQDEFEEFLTLPAYELLG
jgi:malate synthase